MNFEKLAEIIADYKGIEPSAVTPESTFQSLNFDSLDVAEIVMKLEDELGGTIELDNSVKTVGDLSERIRASQANS